MMIGRRGLFGLLAAPAIISITGRLQVAKLIVPPTDIIATTPMVGRGMDYEAFKTIVLPGLREYFDRAYTEPAMRAYYDEVASNPTKARTLIIPGKHHEHREVRRQLRGLQAGHHAARRYAAIRR